MRPVGRHTSRPAPDGSGGGARRRVRATVAGVACVVAVVSVLAVAAAAVAGDRTRPNDPMFENGDQWALENTGQEVNWTQGTPGADIDATRAWNLTTGSRDVVVAILDNDLDYDAEDLAANAWTNPGGVNGCPAGTHGYDVPTGACEPYAVSGHGTSMGWIIGAVGNNGQGMSGVNWTTSIMGVSAPQEVDTKTEGIDWIVDARKAGVNVRVINASFAALPDSPKVRDAIARAGQHGILFVTGAGNDGEDNDTRGKYPCNFDLPNVICVAASDQHDELAPGSAYGDQTVHLAAPGRHICAGPNSSCGGPTSTSDATAFVSGAAALVWSHDPGLTADQVRSAILGNVDRLDSLDGKVITGGRLNVYRAMTNTDTTWPSPSESDSESPSPSESDSESPSPSPSESDSPSPSETDSGSESESESPSGSSDSGSDGSDDTGSGDVAGSDGSGSSGADGDDTGSTSATDDTSATDTTGGDGDTDGPGTLLLYTDSFGAGDGRSHGDSTALGGAGDSPGGQASATGQPSTSTDRQATAASGGGTAETGTADDGGTVGGPAAAAGPDDGGSTAGWWWAAALATLGLAVWLARPFTATGR